MAIQIYEPLIPIPAEPQLEVSLSYSRAKFSSGPSGRGLSSLSIFNAIGTIPVQIIAIGR